MTWNQIVIKIKWMKTIRIALCVIYNIILFNAFSQSVVLTLEPRDEFPDTNLYIVLEIDLANDKFDIHIVKDDHEQTITLELNSNSMIIMNDALRYEVTNQSSGHTLTMFGLNYEILNIKINSKEALIVFRNNGSNPYINRLLINRKRNLMGIRYCDEQDCFDYVGSW